MSSSGNTFTPTQAPAANKGRQQEQQACLPVTVRIIENAVQEHGTSDDPLRFYGVVEPSVVVLVAAVEELSKQAVSMDMQLSDGTGRIKARYYFTEQLPKGMDLIEAGRYIAIVGNVRTAPTLHISIVHARMIDSANEISYHSIAAAHAALKVKRNSRPVSAMDTVMEATPEKKKKAEELSAKPEVTPEKTKSPTMMDIEPAPVVVKPAIDVAPLLDRIRKVMARDAPAAG